MEILSHFRTIEELTKTLSREQGLLSEMFEKRKLIKFPLGLALELVGGSESRLKRLLDYGVLVETGNTIEIESDYLNFFEEVLNVNEEISVLSVQECINTLKEQIGYFLQETNANRKASYQDAVRHLLKKTGFRTLKNVVDLKRNMDNAYKVIRKLQSYGTRVLWLDKGATIPFGDITWRVYRNQPTHFTDLDDGNAYAFVNDGSLVLWSPETQLLLGGDGPSDIKDAIKYFGAEVSGYDISHHGNSCSMSNAEALKAAGCVVAWETNIERDGAGTTDFTQYGARRVKQVGIPVWMQDAPINIQSANGRITFQHGSKTISKSVPYKGDGMVDGWGKDDKGWYYVQDGQKVHGWHRLKWSNGTDWFLFSPDGTMLTGWQPYGSLTL